MYSYSVFAILIYFAIPWGDEMYLPRSHISVLSTLDATRGVGAACSDL